MDPEQSDGPAGKSSPAPDGPKPARQGGGKTRKALAEVLAAILGMFGTPCVKLAKAVKRLWDSGPGGKILIVAAALLTTLIAVAVWKPPPWLFPAVAAHDTLLDLRDRFFAKKLPRGPYEGFAIAVAHIEGDDAAGSAEQLLAESVKGINGVVVLRFDRKLRVAHARVTNVAEARAHETARGWLVEAGADMLVWGYMLPGGKVRVILTLRNAHTNGIVRLPVDQALEFPVLQAQPFNEAIQAQVIGFLAQYVDGKHPVAGQLAAAIARLSTFAENMPPGGPRDAVLLALNNARTIHGEQSENRIYLDEAEKSLREMLQRNTRAGAPDLWAELQHRLGNALVRLAELERGTTRLQEAAAAYRSALEVRQRERTPLDWASSMNNLGGALTRLGTRQKSTGLLREAVAAFRDALQERIRERVPLDWAGTQNNLGVVLVHLGELENSASLYREAIAAYEESLKERTKAVTPLGWASTKNNLSDALIHLGRLEKDLTILRRAVAEIRDALTIGELDSAPGMKRRYVLTLERAEQALAEQKPPGP